MQIKQNNKHITLRVVTNAENIISKANGGNATQAEVEQAIKQVNAAKQALMVMPTINMLNTKQQH